MLWNLWYPALITVLVCYLLGNLNGSVCISQIIANEDVRSKGSGNAGLTNFFRSYGSWSTLLVLAIDLGKTILACYAGGLMFKDYGYATEGEMIGAIAVSFGHDFPALLGFRGGKGIICGLAVGIAIDWRIAVLALSVFIVIFAITRYVSLGSILGALTLSGLFLWFHWDNLFVGIGGAFLGLLAIYMHRGNIKRLLKGTEKKVHLIHRDKNKE